MTKKELEKYIGKIVTKSNSDYKWMFKVVDIEDNCIKASQGMDIYPQPRAYHESPVKNFYDVYDEVFNQTIKQPTKEELNLYRKYTREIKLLRSNISNYGQT